jgi:hypothetical protein
VSSVRRIGRGLGAGDRAGDQRLDFGVDRIHLRRVE